MNIIEKLGIKPIETFCIGIGDGTNNFVCLEPEVRELEQQRNELLEALITVLELETLCPDTQKELHTIIQKIDPQHRSWEEIKKL